MGQQALSRVGDRALMRLAVYVIVHQTPLILAVVGGIALPRASRRRMLYWLAGYCDRLTRGLHDRVANELDSLSVMER